MVARNEGRGGRRGASTSPQKRRPPQRRSFERVGMRVEMSSRQRKRGVVRMSAFQYKKTLDMCQGESQESCARGSRPCPGEHQSLSPPPSERVSRERQEYEQYVEACQVFSQHLNMTLKGGRCGCILIYRGVVL